MREPRQFETVAELIGWLKTQDPEALVTNRYGEDLQVQIVADVVEFL